VTDMLTGPKTPLPDRVRLLLMEVLVRLTAKVVSSKLGTSAKPSL
jgi:hypothetical protein